MNRLMVVIILIVAVLLLFTPWNVVFSAFIAR